MRPGVYGERRNSKWKGQIKREAEMQVALQQLQKPQLRKKHAKCKLNLPAHNTKGGFGNYCFLYLANAYFFYTHYGAILESTEIWLGFLFCFKDFLLP